MPNGLRISRSLTLISALLCSPIAMSGGITEINLDINGNYGAWYDADWNTELVVELGSASYRTYTSFDYYDPYSNTFSDISGEMRIYMSHDFFSFARSQKPTNPVIGVDFSNVLFNGAPVYRDRGFRGDGLAMTVINWTDTSSSNESVFTANYIPQYYSDQCIDNPSSTAPYCTNFDLGNSRMRNFFITGNVESGGTNELDLGDILIHNSGSGEFSVDPDFAIFNDHSNSDYSLNNSFDISFTLYRTDVLFSESTIFLTTANAVVPVPAAIWLMASGLLGLGAVARRRF